MADTAWLERRRQCWYAVVYVPPALRSVLGKKLSASLHTRDLREAQEARHRVVADFKRQIAEAKAPDGPKQDAVMREAADLRGMLEQAKSGALARFSTHTDEELTGPEPSVRDYIRDRAEQIEEKHGSAVAASFHGVATGRHTPLLLHVPDWLNEGGRRRAFEGRTRVQYERDVAELGAWLKAAGRTVSVETVDRRIAGRFVSEYLGKSDRTAKTQARIISACRSYWTWLGRRGITDDERTPWDRQAPAKGRQDGTGGKERSFTDAEAVTLLNGPADAELHDLMRVCALSGMRIDEPYRLRVRDCVGGVFDLQRAKTAAGVRRIPIHSKLAAIVERRTAGKDPDAFLFPEAGPLREGRERSMMASKRFGLYRNRLGVNENVSGKRNSLVTFHSWRRFFITKAGAAGARKFTLQCVVGHKAMDITEGTYTDAPTVEMMRAVVEAVRLPESVVMVPEEPVRPPGKGGRR